MAVNITTQTLLKTTTWAVRVVYETPDTLVDPVAFFTVELASVVAAAAALSNQATLDSVVHVGTQTVGLSNIYTFDATYKMEETP